MSVQNMQALQLANKVRLGHAAVKRDVKAGRLSMAAALEDDRAASMRIFDLISAQPGRGRVRAGRALRAVEINESRRVDSLTAAQRDELLLALEDPRSAAVSHLERWAA